MLTPISSKNRWETREPKNDLYRTTAFIMFLISRTMSWCPLAQDPHHNKSTQPMLVFSVNHFLPVETRPRRQARRRHFNFCYFIILIFYIIQPTNKVPPLIEITPWKFASLCFLLFLPIFLRLLLFTCKSTPEIFETGRVGACTSVGGCIPPCSFFPASRHVPALKASRFFAHSNSCLFLAGRRYENVQMELRSCC